MSQTAIQRAIAAVEYEIEYYQNPSSYQDSEYYVQCAAKVSVLQDILSHLRGIQKEEEQ